jgi:aldehyde:ferredoxin oxidoreductase
MDMGSGSVVECRKPEYETLAAFGSLILNDDLEAILQASDVCDRHGLDTISTGGTVAFAMECAEHGLISREESDGLDLSWGSGGVLVELVRRIAQRQGIGDILADGVRRAAERIGRGAEEFAMHAGGQELPMHDPRYEPVVGLAYVVDATPGRHNPTNGGVYGVPALREVFQRQSFTPPGRYSTGGKGQLLALMNRYIQAVDCSGLCSFSLLMGRPPVRQCINAATGWDLSLDDLLEIGYRSQVLRQLFNIRLGQLPTDVSLPDRACGQPPLDAGPLKGVSLDMETMRREFYRAMDFDEHSGIPTRRVLERLGLTGMADDLEGVC